MPFGPRESLQLEICMRKLLMWSLLGFSDSTEFDLLIQECLFGRDEPSSQSLNSDFFGETIYGNESSLENLRAFRKGP
jgi:hypothetical protein